VADFYRGKTVRILVGTGAGGLYDVAARSVSRYIGKYIPGNPTVIVENKTGAGGMIAYNAVYNTEAKDGTVLMTSPPLVLAAALGAEGVSFDPGKMIWLGSGDRSFTTCIVRSDLGLKTAQDLINGPQLAVGSLGPGNTTNDVPQVLNAALGTNFKVVGGYDTLGKVRLAIQSKEVDGYCPVFSGASTLDRPTLEGDNPFARILLYTSNKSEEDPLLKGAAQAESLAKTDDAKAMIRAVDAGNRMTLAYAMGPGVPADRVAALRKALAATFKDPQFLAEADQAKLPINPNTAEEVEQVVRDVLAVPPSVAAKLKDALK
jgi:tripartite-type tricarboxylate transporter receptor subunit TctC